MGSQKRLLEDKEVQEGIAIELLKETDCLVECDSHEDVLLDNGLDDSAAQTLGERNFRAGEYSGVFSTKEELAEAIRNALANHGADACERCENGD